MSDNPGLVDFAIGLVAFVLCTLATVSSPTNFSFSGFWGKKSLVSHKKTALEKL